MGSQLVNTSENAQLCWQQCAEVLSESKTTLPEGIQQQAERVFTLSEFVARQCSRKTDLFIELLKSGRLEESLSFEQMEKLLLDKFVSVNSEQQLSDALRIFRNQQMVAIYWRDLLDIASVRETCNQVSNLADICIQQACHWLYEKLIVELGTPMHGEDPQHLMVIGMGKLGGNELNVSSDIDLIFCYPDAGETKGGRRPVSHEKFFNNLGRQLIKVLDQKTAEGFVFRVDMRLRPYGDSGPLVMSFAAMEEYYQDQGKDWERFAFVKARIITGSSSEREQLYGLLKPFVFRRYIDFSVLESPRQMKNLIHQELRRRNLQDNIKLGPGGIREVEFIAQALQLIHGGREPALQVRSIFKSLPELVEKGLLSEELVIELLESYLFLRKVEHRVQAFKDQQTQELPIDEQEKENLAHSLDYDNWESFRIAISEVMEKIHHEFNTLFQDSNEPEKKSEAELVFQDIWLDCTTTENRVETILEEAGFDDVQEIADLLQRFRGSSAVRHMGPRGAKRLDQLMPEILQTIASIKNQSRSLNRILRLLSSICRRTSYLELLAENEGALKQMIHLCASSARIADQIADYPYVLDELLNPNILFHPPDIGRLPDMLRQFLCRIPEDDPELQMDCLREFQQINLLRITAADIAGALTVRQVSRYLTVIAEIVIESVVNLAWQELSKKHGIPKIRSGSSGSTVQGFAIIAYGKLGGHELGYGSDLDLVFIHEAQKGQTDGEKPVENNIFYMRLAQKIIHLLSMRTRSGVLYEVDMRLRPSGNSGLLVTHIDAFIDYQQESAWTWEHQALIRGRCILGSATLMEQFEKIRTSILCQQRNTEELREKVTSMRDKMRDNLLDQAGEKRGLFNLKQSRGGIADIEFITQFLVLKLAAIEPNLAISSNTSELLSYLASKETYNVQELKQLVPIYADLRKIVNNNALQNKGSSVTMDKLDSGGIQLVTKLWNDLLVGKL
ncbi:MAG: bifunctional [glutamate--ammonia ligase]-adenylyl-L-tyrosine phosphorylase/[glutamate--ammonia-ligase] adenylyltransferase [Gammaproteobacteria bacterium]|nr:bifunctional [glutamate--ammonia ligase]-adenylyl-L-tyrosine phosphorylase/[glutamate--ammonia-ligase] adenylyltransferase [Gammaproteobacteria bacterium]